MSEQEPPSENAPPPEGGAAKPEPEKPKETANLIGIDQFAAVELKVARIVEADAHPDADKLLVMKVDIGEEAPRQLVAGIRADWNPEDLVGRTIVVVANLKPARLRGVESQGMLLAVRGVDKVIPLGVDGEVKPGTRVT